MSIAEISPITNWTLVVDSPEEVKTKACTKCGVEKPMTPEFFNRDKSRSSGFRSRCRLCRGVENRKGTADKKAEQRVLSLQAQINRNAILRLIAAHRTEFESYVNAEKIKVHGSATYSKPPAWITLS